MFARLGASMGVSRNPEYEVESLAAHIPRMEGFHRRYMVSNKVLRLWAAMVRQLDIRMIAPQHGAPMVGAGLGEFIDWVEQLACGIHLFGAANYRVPG